MIEDLKELNRRIATHWLGHVSQEQDAYLGFASVCVARMVHNATELRQILTRLKQEDWTLLTVGELNHRYLTFARLVARDSTIESIDLLVRLGITLRQAAFLRTLSDDDLERLAFGGTGPLIRFSSQAFRRGVTLHAQAGKHHATAFVAARLTDDARRRP